MAIGGRFIPKNPQKYAGNPNSIMFRSTWELTFMKFLDSNQSILKWASEEVKIPYVSPLDGLVHHYYPDFIIVYTDKYGAVQKEIVEIKPASQSLVERAKSDRDKAALIVNMAKWKFASQFAQQRGMNFRVVTEDTLFKKGAEKKEIQKPAKVRKPTSTRKPSKTRPTK